MRMRRKNRERGSEEELVRKSWLQKISEKSLNLAQNLKIVKIV